ncbi:protein TASOR 2 isoform X2 [Falco naumanni]|uniref:protein TASOR 2 isoform X1 n=2 Tax=Falco naumanni TaxID=148594 RepID=UPI001ADE5E96|nr:protein TASOR 2 isoform X1 [Falco naumanni]XP_040452795.1 protein TASOR 2 isoform X2 [Falco naumanni]
MGERRDEEAGEPGAGFHLKSEESSSLLQTAVSVLQSSYLDSTSQDGFQYSQAILVENDVFRSELKAFAQAKEAAGYSQEELEETFAFLLFDNEEEAKEVCQTGLRVNSSSISTLGDPAKGVYISKYADCLHPRPWYHGKSGYIVICKLIKGKVKVISENYTTSYTCPSPGYDCHVALSRNNTPSKTSHCQAFEQSQYYVYEVSDGSTAERPRQICPYIVIACRYRELKEMPVLSIESLPELNHKVLYCPWRGELSIQGQLLCSIALRTPYSSTIPAQLPPNLDITHVMGLSDLKKKLPEAAFGKRNYIENEVCFQGVYFSLYEVEISNKDQYKMDQLLENLKEKDLAIIKYLQDQGVLILLASSALASDDEFDPKEPVSLLALFLFTSSRSVCLGVEKHDPEDEREDCDDSDFSLKIASVLPGLHYALQKTTISSWGDSVSTSIRIKQHLQEYAKLDQSTQPTTGQNSKVPLSSLLSPTEDECTNPFKKHSEQSFSQLQHYLSDPSSYTLEMSAALECFTGAVQSLCSNSEADCKVDFSSAVPLDPIPPNTAAEIKSENPKPAVGLDQSGEAPVKDVNSASKLWVQQSRRKSNRAVVTSTRKKWSPLKMQMHPIGDSGRNRKATKKKKINIAFSFPKKPGFVASSNEPMLKLANLQFPHRRKRGAEVLSAEFVHKTQSEPVQKETSVPDDPGLETKRPKTLKNPERKKVPIAENIMKPMKSKILKRVANNPSKPQAKKQAESELKQPFSVVPSAVSSQCHGPDSQMSETCPGGVDLVFDLKGNDYESHALNLLADLALGSCIPSFIPRDSGMIAVSCSPTRHSAKEQQSHRKHKSLRVASDHEYHRVDKLTKGATSPSKASLNQKLPPAEKVDLNDLASIPREKSPGIFSKNNNTSPSPTKPDVLPPRDTQEAADVNKHSFISAEHSYASQMPEHSKKHMYPRGAPYPGPAPSRNGTRNTRAGPLVGKVLPFCHQQNSSHPQRPFEAVAMRRRSSLLSPRLKEDFAKSHTVNICGESVKVMCHWEAEYLFNLDSRYTNDALEKTVIRALHGPWDPDLPDDVEEMKLILHMWVALFYSKPSKFLSSTRKVVEHSNPEKYVSINSTGDFLELSDDGEDCFGLETCPADSRSDPDQTPSSSVDRSTHYQGPFHPEESPADSQTDADETPGVVDSTVSSSSGELHCGEEEPSSTSCSEHLSLAEHADESLAVNGRQPAAASEEHMHDVSTIAAVELPKEELPDAVIAPSPSDELGNASKPPAALDKKNPCSQALNSCTAPWRVAPCVRHGHGQQQESGWAAGSGGDLSSSEDRESMGGAEHCTEVEDSSWATSDRPQRTCDSVPLEASPESANPDGTSGEERKSQDPFGHLEIEEEEMEEEKKGKDDPQYERAVLGPFDLSFSENGDADMEHEHSEEKPVNLTCPKDFGVPGEGPVPSPTTLASPCPGRSTPVLSDGTGTGPQGLSVEVAPSLYMLQEPWEALDTPDAETNSVGLAHPASPADVGSPCDSRLMLPLPSDPSLVCGAQPDSITGNLGPAGEALRVGLEQKDKDCAPSAERWALAGSKAASTAGLESLCSQGLSLTLSPDSSSVCLTSLDRATDPEAAPEDQEAMASIQSPSQSNLGGSRCPSQRCGCDIYNDLTSLSTGESNQEENNISVENQLSGPSANCTDVLDESLGAGDGQGFVFNCTALVGDSEAGESDDDVCLGAEKSPGSDKMNIVMVANTLQEPETSLHHLLELEPSSLVTEGMSVRKDHPNWQQSSPDSRLPPAHAGSGPPSPCQQDPLPHGGDTDTPPSLLEQSEGGAVLCQHRKSCKQVDAAEVIMAAESPDSSLKPRCAEEVKRDMGLCYAELAGSSSADVLVSDDPESMPPSPLHGHKADLHGAEPDSVLGVHSKMLSPGTSPAPDGAAWFCCVDTCPRCASPGGHAADVVGSHEKEPIMPEDLGGGGSITLASPASFSAGESLMPLCEPQSVCNQGEHEAEKSDTFADLHHANMELGGEIPTPSLLVLPLRAHRCLSGESLSDAEDISDVLPRAKQLPSKDRHTGLTFEDLFETSSSDSDQEYSGGTSQSLLAARGSYGTRSVDDAGTRTNCDSSSTSSVHTEGHSGDWGSLGVEGACSQAERSWLISRGETSSGHVPLYVNIRDSQGIVKNYQNFVVTKKCQERMGNLQPSRRSHCAGQSHLLGSLMDTWRGFEEITQHTLDMECLRFHYKLKQILRSGKPPFSTSKSIFPKDFSPGVMSETLPVQEAPVSLSPRSRSPLQVTVLPSDTWPSGLGQHQQSGWRGDPCTPWQDTFCNERSRVRSQTMSQGHAALSHLSKLKYANKLKDSEGEIAVILDKYAEFNKVMLSRADAGSKGRGPVPVHMEAAGDWTCTSLPGRMAAFKEMIADLCSALRFHLRSVAKEACSHTSMFYLVETGKDPFFARVKTLLKKHGRVEIEPLSFCEAKRLDADMLLIVIRNEDISSHIHNVPCLLKLKHCPNVVFAGVDSPEDITGHTYQELFHTGGFMVSDDEMLEMVTLAQLKEMMKVLEKLNRSGRWKWLLHYKESKKLRDVSRVDADAHKKHLILKSCQGAELIEVLHYHACDSGSSPKAEYIKCLLNLQVQRVSARFAVYLTEEPSVSREVLESKGILVTNINTFLGTMQEAAAPFRRSYW